MTTRKLGRFMIRCAELCGLWHGHMAFHGRVVSGTDFSQWVAQEKTANQQNVPDLGPYSRTYFPEPLHRAG